MNKLMDSKLFHIILSLLIASGLWLYVVSYVNTSADDTVHNVPVVVIGEDVLESRGLMITGKSAATMDIRVEGNRRSLVRLTQENVTVSVDVSGIAGEGEYDLRCNVSLPNTITTGTVNISGRENYRVKVKVEEQAYRTVELRGEFSGSLADGYQAENFILSPTSMEIAGPASKVNAVSYAVVTLTATDLSETYSGVLPFEFVLTDGTRMKSEELECAASTVYVVYPVVKVQEVALKVAFTPGGGATEENVTYCEITPPTIQVSGSEKDVAGVKELILGTIDLSKVGTTGTFTFPIVLASELTNESGVTEAVVNLKISGLSTKVLETDNIDYINPPDDGTQVEVVTQSLKVTLRGTKEELDAIQPYQVRAVADLSEVNGSTGQFRVPVKLTLDAAGGVGVLGSDYTITVAFSK